MLAFYHAKPFANHYQMSCDKTIFRSDTACPEAQPKFWNWQKNRCCIFVFFAIYTDLKAPMDTEPVSGRSSNFVLEKELPFHYGVANIDSGV